MLVLEGKVVARGFALETMSRFHDTLKIDLGGKTLFPAFADAHVHFLQTGLMLAGCSFDAAGSLAEALARLEQFAGSCHDPWILGWGLDETKLREKRLPTVAEIDAVVPAQKVWISRIDLHSAVANSQALTWASAHTTGSELSRGTPLKGPAYFDLTARLISELPQKMKLQALEGAKIWATQKGITSIHALEGGFCGNQEDVDLIGDFLSEPGFHGTIYHQSEDPALVLRRGWQQIGGCLFVDGSFGSRTAALQQPYADDSSAYGTLFRPPETIRALLRMCAHHELQLAMHAIGDVAITQLAEAIDWAHTNYAAPPRPHRIEHFELPDNRSLRLVRDTGTNVSMQPAFEVAWGGPQGMYAERLGVERARRTNPFKTILNYGIPIAGGSDSPVTPMDPFLGIHGFVNHPNPDERVDLNTALAAFILEPHRFSGQDLARGRLEKGFFADFVLLANDPFMVPPSQLKDLTVHETWVAGKKV